MHRKLAHNFWVSNNKGKNNMLVPAEHQHLGPECGSELFQSQKPFDGSPNTAQSAKLILALSTTCLAFSFQAHGEAHGTVRVLGAGAQCALDSIGERGDAMYVLFAPVFLPAGPVPGTAGKLDKLCRTSLLGQIQKHLEHT